MASRSFWLYWTFAIFACFAMYAAVAVALCGVYAPVAAQAAGTAAACSTAVSGASGQLPLVTLIGFCVVLCLYRVAQYLVGLMPTKVGTPIHNGIAQVLGVLFGGDAVLKNRVCAVNSSNIDYRATLANEVADLCIELAVSHPMIKNELLELKNRKMHEIIHGK